MMRQTGGSDLGETSTRSNSKLEALRSASIKGMMPNCLPSGSMTLTSLARISRLMRTSLAIVFTSFCEWTESGEPEARRPTLYSLLSTDQWWIFPFDLGDKILYLHSLHRLPTPLPRGNRPLLFLFIPQDQHVGNLLKLGLPNLEYQLLIPEILFDAYPLLRELVVDLLCVRDMSLCDSEKNGLDRGQPYGERTPVMLDQHPNEPFHRSEDHPMKHHRATGFPITPHIREIEPFRHGEIRLDRRTLPSSADRVFQFHID